VNSHWTSVVRHSNCGSRLVYSVRDFAVAAAELDGGLSAIFFAVMLLSELSSAHWPSRHRSSIGRNGHRVAMDQRAWDACGMR